ncbi:MAG: DNA polymerase I [Holosporaceae bacterium]|jgi:DNA polymerase-1|nr:DNA polymerase I [Holosporaceae bacterium]
MNKLAVLVDGSGFIYRAYYALPPLINRDGRSVGALYGFCRMLISLLEKHRSDLFCVVLDSGRDTFRMQIYPEYKANRSETPEELKAQLPMLKDVCDAFGVPNIKKKGFEADDIIATYSDKMSRSGYEVRIVSSDKDLMQLVTDKVSLFDPMKSKIIQSEEVIEKYGVLPSQMVFFQALMGDASDNVPGIEGIGPKTASKLINEFQTIDRLYDNIEYVKSEKIRNNLITQKEALDISLKLVTLEKNAEIDEDFRDFTVSFDPVKAVEFLKTIGFESLIKRIGGKSSDFSDQKRIRYAISSASDLKNFFELNRVQKFSFFHSSCINGNNVLAMCCGTRTAYCIFSTINEGDLFNQALLNYQEICEVLKPYLESEIQKIGIKNGVRYFKNIECRFYDDLSVMVYLLRGALSGDKVEEIFENNPDPTCRLQFKNVCEVDDICKVTELIYDNYEEIQSALKKQGLFKIYEEIDRPLINILKNMEENGITISHKKLIDLSEEFSQKIKQIEREIFEIVGCEFNIGSVKQLAEVLFSKLNIPKLNKKTSLDIENLEELSIHSSVPSLVIEWRKLSKLLSGYTLSLCKLADPETSKVHSTFNMASTLTGRLSSSNPNLQNIPHRTKYGKMIREAFISKPNHKLLSFDYSQIELRVLAHMADIQLLKDAFLKEKDIHAITAANLFRANLEEVTEEMRAHAKVINFGIIYGMSPFGLSNALSISPGEAKNYIQNYFSRFPEFEKFKTKTLEFAKKHGYVETITGRRCYIKDISSSNYQMRQFGERQAINAVIQGTASDIVKIAMINISPKLKDLHSKMLIQIHDELVFETEEDFVEKATTAIKNIMSQATNLSVPLKVNVSIGSTL